MFEGVGGEVKDPVIAASVPAPDLLTVGEDEELGVVGGPTVGLEGQRIFGTFRS